MVPVFREQDTWAAMLGKLGITLEVKEGLRRSTQPRPCGPTEPLGSRDSLRLWGEYFSPTGKRYDSSIRDASGPDALRHIRTGASNECAVRCTPWTPIPSASIILRCESQREEARRMRARAR